MNSAAPPPLAPFETIAERIRAHAQARPAQRALVQGDETLDYGALDTLMDRVAASLQRDGVRPGESIAICAPDLAALRSDLSRCAARRRRGGAAGVVGDAAELRVDARRCASALPVHRFVGARRARPRSSPRCPASRWTAVRRATSLDDWLLPAGQRPQPVDDPTRLAVQHHLFVRDDRHAEGHRPVARHALVARRARRRPTSTARRR